MRFLLQEGGVRLWELLLLRFFLIGGAGRERMKAVGEPAQQGFGEPNSMMSSSLVLRFGLNLGLNICIHTYIHTYIHTFIHTYIHTYIPSIYIYTHI